jgi:Signal peptidase, peptidase S26
MSPKLASRPRRWFVYSLVGLFLFLSLSITLAAILLLRRGRLPRTGLITGSSMEPVLRGPRFTWTCPECSGSQAFGLDTCKSHQPFRCRWCGVLDRKSTVDFEADESIEEKINPGDQVRYATLRSMRSIRAMEMTTGEAQPTGLIRGDILVFQESEGAKREVKRVVGFPEERIAIESGDVFVNGERWCKSLEQALRQSILLNAWEGKKVTQNRGPQNSLEGRWGFTDGAFDGAISPKNIETLENANNHQTVEHKLQFVSPTSWLDNQLLLNAHDSHAVIPIQDFGFAFQVMTPDASWTIRSQMRSPACEPEIVIDWNGSEFKLKHNKETFVSPALPRTDKPIWLAIAMVDGYLVAGSPKEEWMRKKLPQETSIANLTIQYPIEISPISGNLHLDQLLVFRDIYYRGQGDSGSQVWEPGDQLVVLGDNVSCSSDSRDRWPDGLSPKAAKGVVLQVESPMEVLLRQRR